MDQTRKRTPKTTVPSSTSQAVKQIRAQISELNGSEDLRDQGRKEGLQEALSLILTAIVEDGEQT